MAKSIMQDAKFCVLCKNPWNLHTHHIFYGTANRRLSDEDGLTVYLCCKCHGFIHNGQYAEADKWLHRWAEKTWMKVYGKSETDFISRYGKTWL